MRELWWVNKSNLDPEQIAIFELPLRGRYLVSGPAGSGKTNLLAMRAKFLEVNEITNYFVIAYTQTLTRFIKANKSIRRDRVKTAQAFLEHARRDLGLDKIEEPDLKKKRKLLTEALLANLAESNKAELYDTLLVDEVQDYTVEELRLFLKLATNVFFVGDVRQKVHSTNLTSAQLNGLPIDKRELKRHYRIGRKICELADALASADKGHQKILDSCQYKEHDLPSEVRLDFMADDALLIAEVVKRCELQMLAYPDELIGILCAKADVLARVQDALEQALAGRLTVQKQEEYVDFEVSRPIVLSTVHSAKGLEFRCVHVLEANDIKGMYNPREIAYTAVTRAKTSLSLYHSSELPPFLADALRSTKPPGPKRTIDDAF